MINYTAHSAIHAGAFVGFVIARRDFRSQGVKVWCESFPTRGKALRAARAMAQSLRAAPTYNPIA